MATMEQETQVEIEKLLKEVDQAKKKPRREAQEYKTIHFVGKICWRPTSPGDSSQGTM